MLSSGLLWATITWNLCGTLLRSFGWCFGLKKALFGVYLGFVLRHWPTRKKRHHIGRIEAEHLDFP